MAGVMGKEEAHRPIERMPRNAPFLALLPLGLTYARDVLAGMATYLRAQPGVELRTGDCSGLSELMNTYEAPIVSMFWPALDAGRKGRRRPPLVNISASYRTPHIPQVIPDNLEVGRMGGKHLLELGFRRLVFVGHCSHWYAADRRDGLVAAASAAGASYRVASPQEVRDGALASERPPFGVLAETDEHARETITACHALGWRVPADVGVVGCNNDAILAELFYPQLSSVDLNARKVGYEAARIACAAMRGEKPPEDPVLIQPNGVVARESSSAFAVSSPPLAHALQVIRERAIEGVSVAALAREARVTPRTLLNLFRQHLGVSVREEVLRVRLERAKELLLSTDLTVMDIAERAGFSSYQRFHALFCRSLGETPGHFRASRRMR